MRILLSTVYGQWMASAVRQVVSMPDRARMHRPTASCSQTPLCLSPGPQAESSAHRSHLIASVLSPYSLFSCNFY